MFINAAVTKHNAFSVHASPMEGGMHDMYCTPRRNSCEFDSRNLAQHEPGRARERQISHSLEVASSGEIFVAAQNACTAAAVLCLLCVLDACCD